MKLIYFCLVFCTISVALSRSASDYNQEVRRFLNGASTRYYTLYNEAAEIMFITLPFSSQKAFFNTYNTGKTIAKKLVELSTEANVFDRDRIKPKTLKRALEQLSKSADSFVGKFDTITLVVKNIQEFQSHPQVMGIPPYHNGLRMTNDDLVTYPETIKIIQKSNDANELLYYWQTWREKGTYEMERSLRLLVESLQNSAKTVGTTTMKFFYRFAKVNKSILLEMENVMKEIMPSYRKLHAFIRRELYMKYGAEVIDLKGPIPDHLFQQVIEQVWTNESILKKHFQSKERISYNSLLLKKKFNARQLIQEAEQFYETLGFASLGRSFYKTRLLENNNNDNCDCEVDVFDDTPDIHMRFCKKVDFRTFIKNHGAIARIHYAEEKGELPAYFFPSFGLEYVVEEAVMLVASTPKYLEKIGLIQKQDITETREFYYLLSKGLNTILKMPQYFVYTKILNAFLEGNVEMFYINEFYWHLMHEYVGVEPPINRMQDDIDFSNIFSIERPQFEPVIFGHQFHRALCQIAGETNELYKCDFSHSSIVGDKLRSMMSLGSSKYFDEVISVVLLKNETDMSAKAFLEYYAPVFDWVTIKNNEHKDMEGWNKSKKQILDYYEN